MHEGLRNVFDALGTEGTLNSVLRQLQDIATTLAEGTRTDIIDRAGRLVGYVAVANWPTLQRVEVVNFPAGGTSSGGTASTVAVSNVVTTARRRTSLASTPAVLSFGVQPRQLLPANPNRMSLLIQNTSNSADAFVGYGTGAGLTVDNGIRIPRGGSFTDELYNGPIFGVASQAMVCPYVELSSA